MPNTLPLAPGMRVLCRDAEWLVQRVEASKEVREARKDWNGTTPLTVSWQINDGLETVTKTFYPPFTKVDREEDYRIAYDVFKRRYGMKEV
ncbi:hypothetical protein NUACC21_38000 [Scytonema sp. NUACC21]